MTAETIMLLTVILQTCLVKFLQKFFSPKPRFPERKKNFPPLYSNFRFIYMICTPVRLRFGKHKNLTNGSAET